jgi:hypothetical protein
MARADQRKAYCRRQAADCATAASTTLVADVKEAYLNLEQGWLQLAADAEDRPGSLIDPASMRGDPMSMSKSGRPRRDRRRRA